MVLLTITPAIAAAVRRCQSLVPTDFDRLQLPDDPALADPAPGSPISHEQLLGISRLLKEHAATTTTTENEPAPEAAASFRLSDLLKGSKVYVPPPKPKPEPTPEYKALMERLRREEEARAYERMLNPQFQPETFSQRFPASPHAHLFQTPSDLAKLEEDEMTYADVNRQLALIFNVLVSIIACSVCIWLVARHWSTPSRLALSMTGSIVVAVAEVVIYSGYIRRVKEAKQREKAKVERKEVAETWVIGLSKTGSNEDSTLATSADSAQGDGIRFRKGKHR